MQKHMVFLVLILCFSAIGCTEEQEITPVSDHFFGVWANENCELVRTSEYSLLFQRYGDNIAATLIRLDFSEDSIIFNSRAAAIFNTVEKEVTIRAKDLYEGDELIINNDMNNIFRLTNYTYLVENTADSIVLSFFEKPLEYIYKNENKMRFYSPDGTWQTLTKIEDIKVTDPYQMRQLSEASIGECLQEWSLGVSHLGDPAGYIFGLPINTNRHSYMYVFAPFGGSLNIFCRAARIHSNDNGTVLNSNIKLISSADSVEISMAENNYETASADLQIIDSLFIPDKSNVTPHGEYWSLKAVEDSVITLNGSGQYYYYTPTDTASGKLYEWFEYIDYEKAKP